jgi:transposase-like protein
MLGGNKTLPPDKRQLTVHLYQEKKVVVKQICALMGISKPTLSAYVRQAQEARQRG